MADETNKVEMIDPKAMFSLSYGLFILTAKDTKDNGCIINTVQQVTGQPNRISICVNKQNYTHDMIQKTGQFNVSVLTEKVPFSTFEDFGFQTGREVDKFQGKTVPRSANGIVYVPDHANAMLSGKVINTVDCGTHTWFLADVTEAISLSKDPSVTYAYYFAHIKPRPAAKQESQGKVWVCKICGYVYDEAKEGIPFAELPEDWVCPLCKHPKSDFELQA